MENAFLQWTVHRRLVLLAGSVSLMLPLAAVGAFAEETRPPPAAVFSMTNDPAGNTITVFQRNQDGTLNPAEAVPTGGMGTGTPEDSANGLILASVSGESSPTNTRGPVTFLLALNGS